MIKSSECCCYPGTTSLCSSKAWATGGQTYSLVTGIYTIASGTRKKWSNLAFSAFGTTSQKELWVLRKALWQVRLLQGPWSNFTLPSDPKAEQLAISTTRSSFLWQSKPNPKQTSPTKSPGKRRSRSPTREPTYPSKPLGQGKSHRSL